MSLLSLLRGDHTAHQLRHGKVVLRLPAVSDFENWSKLRMDSRKFLEPWEPLWDAGDYTRSAFRGRVKRYAEVAAQGQAFPYFIYDVANGKILGAITLNNIRRGVAQAGTLGYWIGAEHAGQGYMTDALNALIPYAYGELGLHRLEAACLPRNTASRKLLERAGFEREGYAKSYLCIAGLWEDHLLFGKSIG